MNRRSFLRKHKTVVKLAMYRGCRQLSPYGVSMTPHMSFGRPDECDGGSSHYWRTNAIV